MAAVTNTFISTSAKGNREELSDVVNRITPEDTPIYSAISKGKCSSTHPEWETDDLAAPDTNVQTEGDVYSYDAMTPMVRVGNYTQIMSKTGIVSKTQEAVDNAGQAEKLKRMKLKKAIEIRKDVELAMVRNTASVGGATRKFGSIPSWAVTNVSRGAGGANGGFSQATGLTVAATSGTKRTLAKAQLDSVIQQCYESGASARNLYVSPYGKRAFSAILSDAATVPLRGSASGANNSILAAADVYESDFGKIMVIPNRVMVTSTTARNALLLDLEMLSFNWLRKIREDKKIAVNADANSFVMVGEGTLCVKNEKGIGVIADIFGINAST